MIYPGGGYKVMLVLHLLSVVVGFGPWFLNGVLPSMARRASVGGQAINEAAYRVSTLSQFAMYGVFVFGFGALSAAPKGTIKTSDGWAIAAIIVWVAIIGVLHGLVLPAQRALAAGPPSPDTAALTTRQAIGSGVMNVLIVVAVLLMVFGPTT